MLINRRPELNYADITPKHEYLGRRKFLLGLGISGAALTFLRKPAQVLASRAVDSIPVPLKDLTRSKYSTMGEKTTPEQDVTHYNNYYEFGVDKDAPAKNAVGFITRPWSVSVEGEVERPRTFTIEEISNLAPLEERIYRHRCVEAWSIVVPWIGYSLGEMLKQVRPTGKAKFVAFQSFYDVKQMPLGPDAGIPFPYLEGLRLDEALNPLALLCVGMYGETLPNQDGAPVRIVVPWKYGFKSIKSIVKIKLVSGMPPTTWNLASPTEYGFYSNVNPHVDHPRWSQAKERRLGEFLRRNTLIFNGYGDYVASMYTGMDLKKYY